MVSEYISRAFAGHAARTEGHINPALKKKEHLYNNPLTDMVNLAIAEEAARQTIEELKSEDE